MHDVQVSYMKEEPRPPFILDDVKGAILYDIQAEKAPGASFVIMNKVQDVDIQRVKGVKDIMIRNAGKKVL